MPTKFLQHLVAQNYLSLLAATQAMQQAERQQIPLAVYLVQQKILDNKLVQQQLSDFFKIPQINLAEYDSGQFPLHLIDNKFLRKQWILPLRQENQQLQLAILDPDNTALVDQIKFRTGLTVLPVIMDVEQCLQTFEQLLRAKHFTAVQQPQTISEETAIINFVQQILQDAVAQGASDIHFEPYEDFYRIRMRVDGLLYEMIQPALAMGQRIAARLKVLAKLDIAERRLPQDGRFSLQLGQNSRDCRLSTCPLLSGEKIVVRLLDQANLTLPIDALGFDSTQEKLFLQAIGQPQGLILVTGPTGSGKTSTLYTGLQLVNRMDKNISSVEDPVEIHCSGINQAHVNPKIGLSFSQVLRAFLRQDPDIIMVGEIRDVETAEIAIKAAQTGHLVLSTLHTNNAAATVTRLLNMGIAPFNLASSVILIVAQRLARKLCEHCKQAQQLPTATLVEQGFLAEEITDLQLFTAQGCAHCMKGYKGRTGIYEMLPINTAIAELLLQQAGEQKITQAAQQAGMINLRRAALNKVKQGITSLEEINRVVSSENK